MKNKQNQNKNFSLARGKDFMVGMALMANGIVGYSKTINVSEVTGAAFVEYDFGDFKPNDFDLIVLEKCGVNYTLNQNGTIKTAGFTVIENTSSLTYTNLYG